MYGRGSINTDFRLIASDQLPFQPEGGIEPCVAPPTITILFIQSSPIVRGTLPDAYSGLREPTIYVKHFAGYLIRPREVKNGKSCVVYQNIDGSEVVDRSFDSFGGGLLLPNVTVDEEQASGVINPEKRIDPWVSCVCSEKRPALEPS
jgi:hypothetical protein